MERGKKRSLGSAIVLVGVVVATSALAVSGIGPSAATLSFNPNRLAQGRVWLLVASALVVDHPVVLSLLSFAVLAVATLAVCGRRVFWSAAIVGHVGSTLIVYALIGAVRTIEPGAFAAALNARDYGVSAISSSWLGAIATTAWNTRTARRSRATIVIGCCAIASFAFMIRRDTSVLSSEHLVAFALGIGLALPRGAAYRAVGRPAARYRIESPEALARLKALFVRPRRHRRDFDLLTGR